MILGFRSRICKNTAKCLYLSNIQPVRMYLDYLSYMYINYQIYINVASMSMGGSGRQVGNLES